MLPNEVCVLVGAETTDVLWTGKLLGGPAQHRRLGTDDTVGGWRGCTCGKNCPAMATKKLP